MKPITITNAIYQNRIDSLTEALGHLNKAYALLGKEIPTIKEEAELVEYKEAYVEANQGCTKTILSVSSAIGALIAFNFAETYIDTELSDK